MISAGRWLGKTSLLAALTVIAVLPGGCAASGEPALPEKVDVLRVDAPLREPVWVPEKEILLALGADEPRMALVDPQTTGGSQAAHSRELDGLGENAALNVREPEHAYLPLPGRGEISVVSTEDLRQLDSLDVGGSSARVTVDAASEILFTLSADGSEVTGTDLESSEQASTTEIDGGERTLLEAPEKGLAPAFWTAGPEGVAHYAGEPPERKAALPIAASDIAVDANIAQKAYVAEAGRVAAVEGDPEGLIEGELEVVAERRLGEEVEQLDSDELFVYAATADELVAMRRHDLRTVETVEFRQPLEEEALQEAPISGIAAGEESVYLTLAGEPYVLSIEKP